jgi:hypothetical protein
MDPPVHDVHELSVFPLQVAQLLSQQYPFTNLY